MDRLYIHPDDLQQEKDRLKRCCEWHPDGNYPKYIEELRIMIANHEYAASLGLPGDEARLVESLGNSITISRAKNCDVVFCKDGYEFMVRTDANSFMNRFINGADMREIASRDEGFSRMRDEACDKFREAGGNAMDFSFPIGKENVEIVRGTRSGWPLYVNEDAGKDSGRQGNDAEPVKEHKRHKGRGM